MVSGGIRRHFHDAISAGTGLPTPDRPPSSPQGADGSSAWRHRADSHRQAAQALAGLVGSGTVKSNRLAESARTAASTGAYETTWSVLAGALPGLPASQAPVCGLGEILAVAVDCVERCEPAAAGSWGAEGIPGLTEVASRRALSSWSAWRPGW